MASKDDVIRALNARAGVPNTAPPIPIEDATPAPPTTVVLPKTGVEVPVESAGSHAQFEILKGMVGKVPQETLDGMVQTFFPMHKTYAALASVFEPAPPLASPLASPLAPPAPPAPPPPGPVTSAPTPEVPDNAAFWFSGWFFSESNEPIVEMAKPGKGWIERDDGRWTRDARGRPKGSVNKAKNEKGEEALAAVVTAVTQVMPAIATAAAHERGEQQAKVGNPIGTLYVKCFPLSETPVLFSDIAKQAHKALADQGMTGHYLTQEYGKGKGFWVMAVTDAIQGLGGKDVYLDLGNSEALDALATLERFANRVVRGV